MNKKARGRVGLRAFGVPARLGDVVAALQAGQAPRRGVMRLFFHFLGKRPEKKAPPQRLMLAGCCSGRGVGHGFIFNEAKMVQQLPLL